jgi:hypothetical protein
MRKIKLLAASEPDYPQFYSLFKLIIHIVSRVSREEYVRNPVEHAKK